MKTFFKHAVTLCIGVAIGIVIDHFGLSLTRIDDAYQEGKRDAGTIAGSQRFDDAYQEFREKYPLREPPTTDAR